jgi:hypothetical protein
MAKTVKITGTVVLDAGEPGKPVLQLPANLEVKVFDAGDGHKRPPKNVAPISIKDGSFTVDAPVDALVGIEFPKSIPLDGLTYVPVPPKGATVFTSTKGVDKIEDVAIHYKPQILGAAISGKVCRSEMGLVEPFGNLQVELRDPSKDNALIETAVTDSAGEYVLSAKRIGDVTVVFPKSCPGTQGLLTPDYSQLTVWVPDLKSQVPLQPVTYSLVGARIVGQITDGIKGLNEASVDLVDRVTGRRVDSDKTDDGGYYRFAGIIPGTYDLVFPSRFQLDGTVWEIREDQPTTQTVGVVGNTVSPMPSPVVYEVETFAVEWRVRTQDGRGVANRLVVVKDEKGEVFLGHGITDSSGAVRIDLPRGGDGLRVLTFLDDQNLPALEDRVDVHSTFSGGTTVPGRPKGGPVVLDGNGQAADQLRESAVDLTAYPILTEPINFQGAPPSIGGGGGGGGGGGSLSQTVDAAIRDVLNWRPKNNDPGGFSSALVQSFSLREFEGHTEWTWTPRSYTVQTDLGAVTGAQASIFTRAKAALDQSLPLLAGLTALRRDVPDEDLNSIRDVVRSELTQLVNEFGVTSGPRVQRVDELFSLLLGAAQITDPQQVGGELGILGNRFGLEAGRVNTIDDEQNLTNYLILVDYVIGLRMSWIAQRPYFDGTAPQPFLGTQLVILSSDLEVVAESVREVMFAMDSVFIGPSERQTLPLDFSSIGQPLMFVASFFDWIDRFASEEGPRLIQSGGKDGVNAFKPVVADLARHARAALTVGYGGGQRVGLQQTNGGASTPTLPPAYGTPRVQRSLQALADQLAVTQQHALPILAPTLLGDPAAQPQIMLTTVQQQLSTMQDQLGTLQRAVLLHQRQHPDQAPRR